MTEKKEKKEKELNFSLPKKFNLMHLSAIVFVSIILGALVGLMLTPQPIQTTTNTTNTISNQGNQPTNEEVSSKTVDYITNNLLEDGVSIKTTKIEKVGDSLYLLSFDLFKDDNKVNEAQLYVTSDLKNIVITNPITGQVQLLDMTKPLPKPEPSAESKELDLTKTEKPVVELFVMSYCPFGTQMEKGLLPVYNLLKDKVDFKLKFVYYSMHPTRGEVEENLLQRAIEVKEGTDKLWSYLAEFLKDGDSDRALEAVGLKKEDLQETIDSLDADYNVLAELNNKEHWLNGKFPLFNLDKTDNEKYGVQGSPSIIINGTKIEPPFKFNGQEFTIETGFPRNPDFLRSLICSSFNEQPEECNTELSTESPSSGFGFEGTGSNTAATCG